MGLRPLSSRAIVRPGPVAGVRALAVFLLLPGLAGCLSPLGTPLLIAGNLMQAGLRGSGCPRLASLDGSQTPEQLYRGAARCMRRSDTDTAVVLFSLAAAYGRYDALRVNDPSAHQAGMLLRLVALQQLNEPQREALSRGVAAALSEPEANPDLCAAIERIGPPTYQPDYMLRHGLASLRRSLPEARSSAPMPNGGLVQGFNGDEAWNQVLDRFLRCAKA